jgi:hypothetical protein
MSVKQNAGQEMDLATIGRVFCMEHPRLCKTWEYAKVIGIGGLAGYGAYKFKKLDERYRKTNELTDKIEAGKKALKREEAMKKLLTLERQKEAGLIDISDYQFSKEMLMKTITEATEQWITENGRPRFCDDNRSLCSWMKFGLTMGAISGLSRMYANKETLTKWNEDTINDTLEDYMKGKYTRDQMLRMGFEPHMLPERDNAIEAKEKLNSYLG